MFSLNQHYLDKNHSKAKLLLPFQHFSHIGPAPHQAIQAKIQTPSFAMKTPGR